ncbi:hypothetical protein V2G26_006465 [Clonostachys chloroleuca]
MKSPIADDTKMLENMRGRTRDRRRVPSGSKAERADESSTLRGRSRHRASSPLGSYSRNPSPSLKSPNRHLFLLNRVRDSRREHCPSRVPSRSDRTASLRRGQRTRSCSRGPQARRAVDHPSSLRNEFLAEDAQKLESAEQT